MKKFFQFILIPFMALVTPTAIDAAESVYLLGEVGLDGDNEDPNRQVGYRPDTGIAMQSNDGNTFTATVHFWNTAGSATLTSLAWACSPFWKCSPRTTP